ncbi:MAG: helix-hairpin-helix domain-containing protein [Clostridia bacterium]
MAQRGHEIQGMVTELIFSNEANGYKVCEVELEDERITVVGILPDVQPGESIAATGAWKQHSTYGEQFEVTSFEKTLPKSKEAIERYLGSGAIKGIGAALAKRIVDKFGEDTLAVMEQEPERLAEIKGISQAGACEIAEQVSPATPAPGNHDLFTALQHNSSAGHERFANNTRNRQFM